MEQASCWRWTVCYPPSAGARVTFAGGKPPVTDGPFAEAKEVIGGYWMIQAKSREEAIEWAKRCPASENEIIEVRQVHEFTDFPAEFQEAAAGLHDFHGESAGQAVAAPAEFAKNLSPAAELRRIRFDEPI